MQIIRSLIELLTFILMFIISPIVISLIVEKLVQVITMDKIMSVAYITLIIVGINYLKYFRKEI